MTAFPPFSILITNESCYERAGSKVPDEFWVQRDHQTDSKQILQTKGNNITLTMVFAV